MLLDAKLNPTKTTRLVVDSRDRDLSKYPLPHSYTIRLDEPIHDVTTLTLIVSDVPFVAYLIDQSNNQLTIILADGTMGTATIPTGDYTGVSLAKAVSTALGAQFTSLTIQAIHSDLTDNISFSCRKPFSVSFSANGSIARELGYSANTTYSSSPVQGEYYPTTYTYTIMPSFRRDTHANPAILLAINSASVITSVNTNVNQKFAILTPMRNMLSVAAPDLPMKVFNPPVASLSVFSVEFTNYDGSPVDFQNQEHRLEFLLTSLRSAKYQRLDI